MRIFLIVISLFILTSCEMIIDVANCGAELKDPFAVAADCRPLSIRFDTIDQAWSWVTKNIRYVNDHRNWQAPQVTIEKGTGVCRDYSVLFATMLRDMGAGNISVVITDDPYGRSGKHAMVKLNGRILEPQTFHQCFDEVHIIYELSVDRILRVCAVNGSRDLLPEDIQAFYECD
jgi:hypothetical protein